MSDRWLELIRDPTPWTRPEPLPGPIETERLIVRLYRPWMVWAREDHHEEADSIYYVERVRRAAAKPNCTSFHMVMLDRATGEVIGGTGLEDLSTGLHRAEIGYWVRAERQGQGICTEAVGALISSALGPRTEGGWGLRRIIIHNAVDNVASRRVCQKLGLRLEGRLRRARYLGPEGVDGAPGYTDLVLFGVLSDEWDFEHHRAKPGIDWGPGLDL